MNSSFAEAMARATAATRASNPIEATRIIAAALRGAKRPDPDPEPDPAGENDSASAPGPRSDKLAEARRPPRLDPDAELVEPGAAGTVPPDHAGAGLARRLRRPLREVVRGLRLGRLADGAQPMPRPEPVEVPVAPGARFEDRHHAAAAGARGYKLYVPATARPAGLVLMLHGCKQNPEDFAAGTRMNTVADQHGLIVAYPRQTSADNLSACWNWFRPGDQRRDRGEPAILADLTRALAAEFAIPPDRIFVAGLSAGGAMAAVLGQAYPDLFAAAGIHSGVPTGAATDVVSAFAAMRGEGLANSAAPPIRRIIFQGEADRIVHPANATQLFGAKPRHARGQRGEVPGGRHYHRTIVEAADGTSETELWLIENAGHAWSGGHPSGSYTDPSGPDASAEMARFFLKH